VSLSEHDCPHCKALAGSPHDMNCPDYICPDCTRLRAEVERLGKEKQEEYEIATGYHKKWQAAERKLEEARDTLRRIAGGGA